MDLKQGSSPSPPARVVAPQGLRARVVLQKSSIFFLLVGFLVTNEKKVELLWSTTLALSPVGTYRTSLRCCLLLADPPLKQSFPTGKGSGPGYCWLDFHHLAGDQTVEGLPGSDAQATEDKPASLFKTQEPVCLG